MSRVTDFVDGRLDALALVEMADEDSRKDASLSLRIPASLSEDLNELAEYLHTSKSEIAGELLRAGALEAQLHAARRDPRARDLFGYPEPNDENQG